MNLRFVFGSCLAFVSLTVQAHDTWFVPATQTHAFHLNTGSHFPQTGSPVPHEFLDRSDCETATTQQLGQPVQGTQGQFELHYKPTAESTTLSCWAVLKRNTVTLNPKQVKQYLDETRAPVQWREYAQQIAVAGQQWQESYRKSARVEVQTELSSKAMALPLQATLAESSPTREGLVGKPLHLQVLLHGQPLAGQWVELLIDSAPFGFWHQTDENGEIVFTPPVPGQALLRGTHFSKDGDWVKTEFLTHSFVVNP